MIKCIVDPPVQSEMSRTSHYVVVFKLDRRTLVAPSRVAMEQQPLIVMLKNHALFNQEYT
jgi:hypothetical protein